MTRNKYIKDNGYMAWLGRESINNEVKCLLGSFNVTLTNKQVNCFSEMIEKHIKKVKESFRASWMQDSST